MSCVPALVSTTETPVLKFSVSPGIQIDLTADSANSALAVPWIRGVFNKFPILWPTQLFLKALLRRRNLHETYKGGITSYPLLLMCLAYLQYQGPGESLLDFITKLCHFYGNKFNPVLVGIDVRGDGCFFPRTDDLMYERSPAAPYIKDPLEAAHVVGTPTFRMPEIVKLFREIHQQFIEKDGRLFDDFAALIGEFEARRRDFAAYAKEYNIAAQSK
jgi:DNA polymerase sigma